MLKLGNGWIRAARWAFLIAVVVAWLARHGGGEWHTGPGLIAATLAVLLALTTPSVVLLAVFGLVALVGVSGLLLASERWWGQPWVGQMHSVLVLVWLGLSAVYFAAKIVHRNQQLDEFVGSLFQRRKRLR